MSERQYLAIMEDLIRNGSYREGRNGGTYSLFGGNMRFNLQDGFPLLTTKRMHLKSIVAELLWFLSGSTNVKPLQEQGVTIWDEWAGQDGELGPIYGKQWRSWYHMDTHTERSIDQIANVLKSLKEDPYSRRHVVSAWNVADIESMALPPCHCLFQFYVQDGKLSCQLYQRSADWFLGVPYNIASYSLLTHLFARECGYEVGEFIHSFGDLHLYANHVKQAKEQLQRTPFNLPTLVLDAPLDCDMFSIEMADVRVSGYQSWGALPAPVSK